MIEALIIDGLNFVFRGFYGVPNRTAAEDGTPLNAVYGFFALLRRIAAVVEPDHILVAFDSPGCLEEKLLLHPEYKPHRTDVDPALYLQVPLVKECLDALDIRWIQDCRYEADDIIGTFSAQFVKAGMHVSIASTDNDYMQLVSPNISVVRDRRGTISVFGESEVFSKFGVRPEQYADYLCLVGDRSDGIEGIPGIGAKRAASLLAEFDSVESLYERFEEVPANLQPALQGQRSHLAELVTFLRINCAVELPSVVGAERTTCDLKKLSRNVGELLGRRSGGISQPSLF